MSEYLLVNALAAGFVVYIFLAQVNGFAEAVVESRYGSGQGERGYEVWLYHGCTSPPKNITSVT